ncbi:MAG: N-acetylmuramoyl-L-alanine amidase [Geminicoccaceae bacterium]|nr:N-acetylmuramoyl-L-alanine amidase [Geminicoccaceae bacterium]
MLPGTLMFVSLIVGLLVVLGGPAPSQAGTVVQEVRVRAHGESTRVVLDLSEKVAYRHLTLDNPARLAIDLPAATWDVRGDFADQAGGLVRDVRFGRYSPSVSRIVVDIDGPFEIQNVFELPANQRYGHRIVTDLRRVDAASWAAGDGLSGGIERTAAVLPVLTPGAGPRDQAIGGARAAGLAVPLRMPPKLKPKRELEKRIIVIDPGHGGMDPGAISPSGTYEKTIVLDVAQRLKRELEATGRFEVRMTRNDDSTVRLRDRLRTAHLSGGDLFISLHADSLVQAPEVRGIAVYTLSEEASTAEAARLASKENRADILNGIDLSAHEDIVTQILIDLAQRDANNKSIRIAEVLVEQLAGITRLARRKRQSAGFVVLKSPEMPSVLVELGYLSNPTDERQLTDPTYVSRLAGAMTQAVERFFGTGG